jgi:hypothetical protein
MLALYQLCLATGFLYGQIPSLLTSLYIYDVYPYNLFYAIYSTLNISILFYFFYKSLYLQYWIVQTTFQYAPSKCDWGFYFFLGLLNETVLYLNYQLFYPFLYTSDPQRQQCIANPYPSQRIFVTPLFVFLCSLFYEYMNITGRLCTAYLTHMILPPQHRRARSNSPFAVVDDMLD